MNDTFGDRMKAYERAFTEVRLDKNLPVYARLDGRSFSKFTKNMVRPYDERMSKSMIKATEHLVTETKALGGYTQSDEISLVWPSCNENEQFFFDGKIQKLTSVLSSMCASSFVLAFAENFGHLPEKVPSFDCRIINVPDMNEADNMFKWRKQDAFKNSVQSAAHVRYGHSKLMHQTTTDKLKMMYDDNFDFFGHYDMAFIAGTSVRRMNEERWLTEAELSAIPEKHRPTGPVVRTKIVHSSPTLPTLNYYKKWCMWEAERLLANGELELDTEINDRL